MTARASQLEARVALRTARRLERLARRWPAARALLGRLRAALRDLPAGARRRALYGPDLRGFLGETEIWTAILDLALRAEAATGRARRARITNRLFDRLARTEHLASLVPLGRVDRGLLRRARIVARRRLGQALEDLGAVLVGLRLAYGVGGALRVHCAFRADPEQGRPGHRVDLGTIAGPAGPLSLAMIGRRRPGRFVARLDRPLPAPGDRRGSWRFVRRTLIPGTPIILTPALASSSRRLTVTREIPRLERRLARALRIVRVSWPEGYDEVIRQTFVVVPVREAGLVSYSLASRPGVSYINVFGKRSFDLADDLVHESAHHRLHALQEIRGYLKAGPQTEEIQAFDSPWRRARRPLHGLLHGVYTFRFRAELLRRVAQAAARRPRIMQRLLGPVSLSWLRAELRRERTMLARSLADLRRASREGLLTAEGRRLVRGLSAPLRGSAGGRPRDL